MAADPNRAQVCKLRPHEASCAGARRPGRGSHDGRDRVRRDTSSRRGDLRIRLDAHIVEFDSHGRDRDGFRTYDVRDAAHPKALDTLQPPEVLGKNGYWQDEDMEIDTQAQADHRRARSPPRRRRPDELPGHRTAQRQEPQPEVPLGLLRHLLQEPAPPAAGRALQRGAGGPHHELHRQLPLRLDRRPGAPRRPGLPGPVRARRARGRPADLGHGPPQSGEAAHVPRPDRPEAQRRATPTTRTTWTSTATASLG